MSSVLSRPALEHRAFILRPPAVPGGGGIYLSDAEVARMRDEAASGAEERARVEFEEWGRGLEERTGNAVAGLREAARELRDARRALLEGAADQVVELAMQVARKIIRHEVRTDPRVVLPLVRELLQRAAAGTEVTVRLAPRDHALLTIQDDLPEAAGLEGVHFRLDPAITPGGVLVETAAGGLDGRIETQLERIEEALRARNAEAA